MSYQINRYYTKCTGSWIFFEEHLKWWWWLNVCSCLSIQLVWHQPAWTLSNKLLISKSSPNLVHKAFTYWLLPGSILEESPVFNSYVTFSSIVVEHSICRTSYAACEDCVEYVKISWLCMLYSSMSSMDRKILGLVFLKQGRATLQFYIC